MSFVSRLLVYNFDKTERNVSTARNMHQSERSYRALSTKPVHRLPGTLPSLKLSRSRLSLQMSNLLRCSKVVRTYESAVTTDRFILKVFFTRLCKQCQSLHLVINVQVYMGFEGE